MSTSAPLPDLLATAFGPGAVYAGVFATRPADGFYTPQPDETDDLCTALPLTLTRGDVQVWCDARTVSDAVWGLLGDELGVPLCDRSAARTLPPSLTSSLGGEARCEALIQLLAETSPPGTLRIPQPFVDARLDDRYGVPADLCRRLNDKGELPRLVPAATPPTRLAELPDAAALRRLPWPGRPCVVKLTGSCAGEGVFPCADEAAWHAAQAALASLPGPILVERWIDVRRNLDVEFLVPADPRAPFRILGAVEQVIGERMRLAGGVCRPAWPSTALEEIQDRLLHEILPALRGLGWHGIGGFDVLVDRDGASWFMDPNLRITDFTAPLVRAWRCPPGCSLLILPYADFDGSLADFQARVAPIANERDPDQRLAVLGVLDRGDRLLVQAGLLFRSPDELRARARDLQDRGLSAPALALVDAVADSEAVSGR